MSELQNLNINQLRQLKRDLTVNIAQRRTALTKMRERLIAVDARLAAFTPREMTRQEIEAALGYRVKLIAGV